MHKSVLILSMLATSIFSTPLVAEENKPVVTFSVGTVGFDPMTFSVSDEDSVSDFEFDPSGGTIATLGWGVRNDYARCLLEYQYQRASDSDVDIDYLKHHIYFTAQWTPRILNTPVHAIVGASVGGVETRVESDNDTIGSNFRDREEQFKAMLGVEYRLTPKIAIQGMYEHHMTDNPSMSKNGTFKALDDSNQDAIMIGVAMTLD